MSFDKGRKLLSDVIVYSKYCRYLPALKRRETWDEMVDRRLAMDVEKFPALKERIESTYNEFVRPKKVFPSMRSFQFAGAAIKASNNRMFNCCYLPIDDVHAFSETMFLLLGGSGVGYSVQKHHISTLPIVRGTNGKERKYLIQDSIEGWADSVKVLMRAYFEHRERPRFDFSSIRPKGAALVTSGGKAPGPEPLRTCLSHIENILLRSVGRKMTSIEAHDILCHEADAVYAGGIRRAAMISFFSPDDDDMLYAKVGMDWFNENPQRQRANNSAVLLRGSTSEELFRKILYIQKISLSGEPGIYWTNDLEILSNPCVEASLPAFVFCNLCEINCYVIKNQEEFNKAAQAAAFIGTLQASYTDFHYLRSVWKESTEKDALLGVGLTGLASDNFLTNINFEEAANIVVETNKEVAALIGINSSARMTLIKPSGTTSSVLGCSSGLHDWHDNFYVRRIRIGKNEAIYPYLKVWIPDLIVDDVTAPHKTAILEVPIAAPADARIRTSSNPLDLLEREKQLYSTWVIPGHKEGVNTHSISITVSYNGDTEYGEIVDWMWSNKDYYAGISLLETDNTVYPQMPFESISEEEYKRRLALVEDIYLDSILEDEDATDLTGEAACAGGACSV